MATVTPWSQANDKFTQNVSGSVSIAAGFMGSDLATSIDLGGTRVLWLFGDTFWATAAGQTRTQCLFIRNTIALQTGSYDLSAATLTFYAGLAPDGTGTTPGSFFAETGPSNWAWVSAGCMIDDKLLLITVDLQPFVGGLGFGVVGWRAYLVDNPAAAPTAWTIIPVPVPSTNTTPILGLQVLDPGDGYVYAYGRGANDDLAMYAVRWPRAKAKAGQLMDPQWWRGTVFGWSNLPQFGDHAQRGPIAVEPGPTATEGSIHQRSDNMWVTIQTPGFGATNLSSATSSSLSGPFGALTSFYTPPESTQLNGSGQILYDVYAGKGHPEQTWAGKATDDILCSYVANADPVGGASVQTDMSIYFPKFVKVSDL